MCDSKRKPIYSEDWLEKCANCTHKKELIVNKREVIDAVICKLLMANGGLIYEEEYRPTICPEV